MENVDMQNKIEFYPNKKVATGFKGYIPTVAFTAMFVLFICDVVSLFERNWFRFYIFSMIIAVIYFMVYVMTFTFDWFIKGTLIYHKDKGLLEYIEKGVLAIGSDKSTYKLKEVKRVKKKKNSIWLYGKIDAVEGIHKCKLRKVELKTYAKTEEVFNLIKLFLQQTGQES